jgi:hypothetical protein
MTDGARIQFIGSESDEKGSPAFFQANSWTIIDHR